MREIKFRAWDKENKKMVYSDKLYPENMYKFNFDFLNNFKFLLMKLEIPDNAYLFEPIGNFDFEPVDAHIMQYTGIKDANGKEIYEGDIVRIEDYFGEDMIGEIIYDKESVNHIFHSGDKESYFEMTLNLMNENVCYVIENIYENPELLGE